MTIRDYSATAGDNTAIAGIGLSDAMLANALDNAIREMMADSANFLLDVAKPTSTTGASNIYALSTGGTVAAYGDNIRLAMRASFSNTGACTLNVDTLGAVAVKVCGASGVTDPLSGQIQSGGVYDIIYVSAIPAFVVLNPTVTETSLSSIPHMFKTDTVKSVAINRSEADTMADDTSTMAGYAANSSTTGGTAGTIYWVTNGTDSAAGYEDGSFRWAVEQVRTAGSGRVIFAPRYKIDVVLVAQIETPPNITIDAPARNVTIWSAGDVTKLKVVDDNCIIRRLKFASLPKVTSTDRDGIWIDPSLCNKVWVDECSFEHCFDGQIDIASTTVLSADCNITISRCLFRGHDKTMLVGAIGGVHTDPIHIKLTVYQCMFDHVAQRNPKAYTQSFAHVVNCYFRLLQITDDSGALNGCYGVLADVGGQALVEECWFETAVIGASNYNAAYAGTNSEIKINNCQAKDGMLLTETLPGSVVVPPYSITKTTTASDEVSRLAFYNEIYALAGSDADSAPDGVFVFDSTSTAEPNGATIISDGGSTTGRWLRQNARPETYLPQDSTIIENGTTISVAAAGAIGNGDTITIPVAAERSIASGFDIDIASAAVGSINSGRGHTGNAVAYSAVFGKFPLENNAANIFAVGNGPSAGNGLTAIWVDETTSAFGAEIRAVPRKNTVTISAGAVSVTTGYHTVSPETGMADNLDTINFPVTPFDGQEIRIMPASSGDTITLRSGTGNLLLPSGSNVVLKGAYAETATLFWAAHKSAFVLLR